MFILGIPFVNIGNRQDNREKSNVFDAKVNAKDILRKIYEAEKYKSKLYGAGSSSFKIIKF